MTDEELNKWLYENVIGLMCEHNVMSKVKEIWMCDNCGLNEDNSDYYYNYCNSLDAVSRVEAKVVEKAFGKPYVESLKETSGANILSVTYQQLRKLATATARQRAEACKLAWENK